jgi:hypothetical protein
VRVADGRYRLACRTSTLTLAQRAARLNSG